MKLERCVNGHYYDADKYTACPHCSQSASPGRIADPWGMVSKSSVSKEEREAWRKLIDGRQDIVEPALTSADVYRSSAILRSEGTVQLAAGENRICLTGEFAFLDPDSVHFSFPDTDLYGEIQVLDQLPIREEILSGDAEKALKKKAAELKRLKNRKKDKKAELKLLRGQLGKNVPELSGESLAGFLAALKEQREMIYDELDELARKEEELVNELENLVNDWEAMERIADERCLELRTVSENEGSFRFELEYRVSGAGWTPSYDILAEDLNDSYRIVLKGSIFQRTGEDWESVRLCLFGNEPENTFMHPKMTAVYLDDKGREPLYQPGVTWSSWQDTDTGTIRTFSAPHSLPAFPREYAFGASQGFFGLPGESTFSDPFDDAAPGTGQPISSAKAFAPPSPGRDIRTVSHEMTTEYQIPGDRDIPDGQATVLEIKSWDVPQGLSFIACPHFGKYAFIEGELPLSVRQEMMAGRASVYIGHTFFGRTSVNPGRLADSDRLTLGRNAKLTVERTLVKQEKNRNLFRGQESTSYEYEILVRSLRQEETDVTVYDRVPVSRDSSVMVKIEELSGGEKMDDPAGGIVWKLKLGPGEEKKLKLAYQVLVPTGKNAR